MGSGRCRSGPVLFWIWPRTRRSVWCGPCAAPATGPTCGRRWLQVRSASTGWKPSPGYLRMSDCWSTWMWPEYIGKQRNGPGSTPKPNQNPGTTVSSCCSRHLTSRGGNCGAASTECRVRSWTRSSPRLPTRSPRILRGGGWTRRGGGPPPSPSSASQTLPHQPRSPCSSTAEHAAPTNGEAGITLETGPRIGRKALEALLCESVTEITVHSEDGTPMAYGRRSRSHTTCAPPGDPPPRRRPLRRRQLRKPTPTSNPPHQTLEPRRDHRPRQPDHPLLVPPPSGRTPTRIHPIPPPQNRANPIPQTTRPGTADRLLALELTTALLSSNICDPPIGIARCGPIHGRLRRRA